LQGSHQFQAAVSLASSTDVDVGRVYVAPSGDMNAVTELDSMVVGLSGEKEGRAPVYLKDLGLEIVRDYEDPPTKITRYGDQNHSTRAIGVAFTMKRGANIVDICGHARALIERLTVEDKILPPDISLTPISDQSVSVTRKIDDFLMNVIGAVLIVVAVVFLMVGFRSAMVMAAI